MTTHERQTGSYRYRIDSCKPGNHIRPQTFVENAGQVFQTVERHRSELPGCTTLVTDLLAKQTWPMATAEERQAVRDVLDWTA
jgi:hypothetical protein